MNESNGVLRDARKLGIPKMLILGLQHMFAMFGATILVPILVNSYFVDACGEGPSRGLTVSVTLFCAGFGTLLFHLCAKFKVPAFLGSSFAFLSGFAAVANLNTGKYASMSVNDKAAYACGGIVVAGLLYLIFALIIRMVGVKRVMRYLPPVVTGPVIICIGLSLAGSAINNASTNWFLALVALAVIIIFNIWGKGMFKIIPILMGVVIAYAVAVVLNALGIKNPDGSVIINFVPVAQAGIVGLPPLQLCKFDLTSIMIMAPIAIATMMEHVGDMSAISATVGENFLSDPGLHRTLLGDGLATAMAGFIGGPANTTYGENTGVLELSRVHDPKQQAEDVLKQLGIPMATAIDMYLRQITLTGGIPFSLSLPKAPTALNADTMTDDQLHAALQVGIKEIQNGDTVDAASAFAQFREQHR